MLEKLIKLVEKWTELLIILQKKTPVPEEVKSLERYELEKQAKLLINLPEEVKSGRSRVCVSSRSGRNC